MFLQEQKKLLVSAHVAGRFSWANDDSCLDNFHPIKPYQVAVFPWQETPGCHWACRRTTFGGCLNMSSTHRWEGFATGVWNGGAFNFIKGNSWIERPSMSMYWLYWAPNLGWRSWFVHDCLILFVFHESSINHPFLMGNGHLCFLKNRLPLRLIIHVFTWWLRIIPEMRRMDDPWLLP